MEGEPAWCGDRLERGSGGESGQGFESSSFRHTHRTKPAKFFLRRDPFTVYYS